MRSPAASLVRSTLWAAAALGLGCTSIPNGAKAVDALHVDGNRALGDGEIEEKLATTPTKKFLGVARGIIHDYRLFDRQVLDRDLERVERYYRARGFYEARVRAGRVVQKGPKHVEVTIEVDEGAPVVIGVARLEGIDGLPPGIGVAARAAVAKGVRRGARFEEEPFEKTERAVERVLTDQGYAYAKVSRAADVDLVAHAAEVVFHVVPGPACTFGDITIVGLGKLPEAPVRRALDISRGERFSTNAIDAGKQAVLDLGTFSSVDIEPVLRQPPAPDHAVPLRVRVEPQRLRSLLLGGGVELDPIKTEAHLHVGWEHKSLFGGFRHFSVDFQPGVDLFPTRLPELSAPTALLPMEKLRMELRTPGFVEARTNGFVRGELNAYPVLLTPDIDPKAPVLGYAELKASAGIDRTIHAFYFSPSYNLQIEAPFAYQGALDPDLVPMVVSYVDLSAHLDLRNDRVEPHRGLYLQNDLQVAGGVLGGDGQDVRVQPEVRGYLPMAKKVTLALRGTVGFLFPIDYGRTLADGDGRPGDRTVRSRWVRDLELVYLRGFFSGGPSSNRGYPLRGVGPHGTVPFFDPGVAAAELAQECQLKNPAYDPVRCSVPIGGLSLWEASVELRLPISDPLGGVMFCDASDVSPSRFDLRLDHPHLSCGLGVRLGTPIGPVRLDVGYRIPGLQVIGGVNPRIEGDPGTILGLPIAFAFGIGEAF